MKSENQSNRYYVGIDAGSVSLNGIVIDRERSVVHVYPYKRHLGKVEEALSGLDQVLEDDRGEADVAVVSCVRIGNQP